MKRMLTVLMNVVVSAVLAVCLLQSLGLGGPASNCSPVPPWNPASSPFPTAAWNGDINGDCSLDIGDAVSLLSYLFASGPPPAAIAAGSTGGYQHHIVSSPGASIWTTPANITSSTVFKITMTGAGGAGGGSNANSCGGGGGGTCLVYLSGLSPSAAYLVTVGAGGTGSLAVTGQPGGATTLTIGGTVYSANGGSGGGQGLSRGIGGLALNGSLNVPGGDGGEGTVTSPVAIGGMGGGTVWGSGAAQPLQPFSTLFNGHAGKPYGAGGSGAVGFGGSGGSGASGVFMAEWISD